MLRVRNSSFMVEPLDFPLDPEPESAEGETRAWWGAIACWCCLLGAALLYGTAALAPRLLTYVQLQHDYASGQAQLVALETQVQQMDRVATTLETDPQFAADLARVDFEVQGPDETLIRVPAQLALEVRDHTVDTPLAVNSLPWYTPVLRLAAENRAVNNFLLGAAAVLAMLSFVLSTGGRGAPATGPLPGFQAWRYVRDRYAGTPPSAEHE